MIVILCGDVLNFIAHFYAQISFVQLVFYHTFAFKCYIFGNGRNKLLFASAKRVLTRYWTSKRRFYVIALTLPDVQINKWLRKHIIRNSSDVHSYCWAFEGILLEEFPISKHLWQRLNIWTKKLEHNYLIFFLIFIPFHSSEHLCPRPIWRSCVRPINKSCEQSRWQVIFCPSSHYIKRNKWPELRDAELTHSEITVNELKNSLKWTSNRRQIGTTRTQLE